jgi:hypothetical protein
MREERKVSAQSVTAHWAKKPEYNMIAFGVYGGHGAPAPWLQIVGGSGVILYWVYRIRKEWHTIGGGEIIAALIICLLAGIFLVDGLTIVFHH